MKGRTLIYNSLFWIGIYLLWVLVFNSYSVTLTKTMTVEFCYLIFITADYYAVNNFIVPKFLFKEKYFLFALTIVIVIALSALLRALISTQINRHFFNASLTTDFNTLYINSFINISLWVLLITIGKMLVEWIQTQRQIDLLEQERVKSELDYLKAQINPHALFNSLNTIYGHIDKSNQVARNTLLQFSELLKYQLYDCGAEKVNLEEEIDYIRNYVAFQRLRKDENLIVNLKIENIDNRLKIAPLLLIVLIENAFKFVSNFTDKENKICIRIYTKGNILLFSLINTIELSQAGSIKNLNGIGIRNLKRRLELLYSNKFELITNAENGFYKTSLNIDLT
ncbi:MAG TPA: histidine kinase [Puia sp.]|nr:histidine kinase [Puia sp.]